jgi:hypothetical protein
MRSFRGFGRLVVLVACAALGFACGDDGNGSKPSSGGTGGVGASGAASGTGGKSPIAGSATELPGAGEGGGGATECDCDDGIACTSDECVDGACQHQALHFACAGGEYCSLEEGCLEGEACAQDDDCERPDNCLTATCNTNLARCVFEFLDSDSDGRAPESCGGNDCDDGDGRIHGDQPEVCDGIDNDCDGVTDPETESSCGEGLVCIGQMCRCPAPGILCDGPIGTGQICVDPTNDSDHCGNCQTACSDLEECVNRVCECAAEYDVCGSLCVDFQTDIANCGECGNHCGNGECFEGGCICPNGGVDCSASDIPDCVDTDTDLLHCGGCNERCLDAGACQQGDCDTTLEWLKIFHGQVSAPVGQGAGSVDTDASGNIYVAATAGFSSYRAFPDGQNVLFTGPGLIAKFNQNGELQWAEHSNVGLSQLAVVGSEVWVSIYVALTASITVAGHTFNLPANAQAFTALLKLDGATGDVADFLQIDYPTAQGAGDSFLLHDASHVWLVQGHQAHPRLGDTTWTPPGTSSYNSFVYSLGSEQPLWLAGAVRDASRDAAGKLVLQLSQDANATVNFGGQDLVFGASGGQALVRLTSELAHDASFVGSGGRMVPGAASLIYPGGYTAPILSQLSLTGETTSLVGPNEFFSGYRGRAVPGYIAIHGYTNGGQLSGRSLPLGANALVTYSDSTYTLERALAFHPNGIGGNIGGILDFALVDGGQSAVLLVRLENGLTLKGQSYDIGYGYHGLALIKVNLHAP